MRGWHRQIAWSTDTPNVEEIARLASSLLPEAGIKIGPGPLLQGNPTLGGAPDPAEEEGLRAIWAGCTLRNDRMIAATVSRTNIAGIWVAFFSRCQRYSCGQGVTFRPLEESVRDCVESLMSIGGVEPERTDEYKARL